MDKTQRIRELVESLNYYRDQYYNHSNSVISDFEYDKLFDELDALEKETGFVMTVSPTQAVGYEVKSELTKVKHNHPMLSLDKTKDIEQIKAFVGDKDWIAMLKMDGLTLSLLYESGRLVRAETRGDGNIGEDVTHNAMVIPSIPKTIPYAGRLVIDGEVICKFDDFEEFVDEYKNARNFASGSIRLLDSEECAKRKLTFVAWDAIGGCAYGDFDCKTLLSKLCMLMDFNFIVVPCMQTMPNVERTVDLLKEDADIYHYPIDGVVFKWNNCAEYESAGRTEHHFRGGLAYKFYDELYETQLLSIEWTIGKTGVLTPTAIFKPVVIDGTTIERASLHNISVMKNLLGAPYIGQKLQVYKANCIIPSVYSAEKLKI